MSLGFGLAGVVALGFCIIQVRIAAGALTVTCSMQNTCLWNSLDSGCVL